MAKKSNSFKLVWVSLLPARMRKIHSKMRVLEWSQQISNCKSMQIREVNSTVWGWIYFKFKLIQAFMVVLVPARMKKIQSKLKALKWSQQCYIIHQFLRCSRAANSLIGDGILTKFKLIRAFIVVLLI